jgi:hypothetical protein
MWQFLLQMPQLNAHLSSFKLGEVSHIPILPHSLSFNTIINGQIEALQSAKKKTEEHSELPTEVISM